MKIYILFVSYKNGDGPDAVSCMDEFSNDINPDYLESELKKYSSDSAVSKAEILTVVVDGKEIEKRFAPLQIVGEVKPT